MLLVVSHSPGPMNQVTKWMKNGSTEDLNNSTNYHNQWEADISNKSAKYTKILGVINNVLKPSPVQRDTQLMNNKQTRQQQSYGLQNEIHVKNSRLYKIG
jgi:hypothetical protein